MCAELGRVNLDFMVRLAGDPAWAAEEMDRIEAYNTKHGALFGGEPVPTSIKPNFISQDQQALIGRAVERLIGALDTFVDRFLASEKLQRLWDVTEQELELYRVDPGYPGAIQISRFDGFLEGGELKFLEFNCDSPGGAGYADVIHEAFTQMYERNPKLDQGYAITQRSRVLALRDVLERCWVVWREANAPDRPADPFVVVADWPDVGSRPDIDITVHRLREGGMEATFADPRDLVLDGDELILEGRRVDLVYKRVILKELLAEPAASDLLDAYREGTICMVNSPRSVIVGNKKIMAALRLPEVQAHLSPDERRAIEAHVPWTQILRDAKVPFQGYTVHLRDFVIDNQDQLVLKAAQSYGGRDVVLGMDATPGRWASVVDAHITDEDWVVQELVNIPQELYPRITGDEVHMELMNVNLNPFVFGGEYAGAYTRISQENIINVSAGGGLAPTITVQPDDA